MHLGASENFIGDSIGGVEFERAAGGIERLCCLTDFDFKNSEIAERRGIAWIGFGPSLVVANARLHVASHEIMKCGDDKEAALFIDGVTQLISAGRAGDSEVPLPEVSVCCSQIGVGKRKPGVEIDG